MRGLGLPSPHAGPRAHWLRIAGLATLSLVLVAAPAWAQSTHFKHGSPSFTDNGVTLTAYGGVTGLGNGNLVIQLSARGQPTAVCTNPSGANQPAGQNPAEVTLTGTQAIPGTAIKNGNANFDVTTNAPTSPVPGAPECPNSQWTETITDVAFTSATLVFQQNGVTVLRSTCTFSPATSDGAVPASSVSCT